MTDLGVAGESVPLVGGRRGTETGAWLTNILDWLPYITVAWAIPSRPLGWRSTTGTTACLLDMGPIVILRLLVVLNLWWLRLTILGWWTRTGCTTTP